MVYSSVQMCDMEKWEMRDGDRRIARTWEPLSPVFAAMNNEIACLRWGRRYELTPDVVP